MPTNKRANKRDERGAGENGAAPPTADERLHGLLADLGQLREYLDERGAHTYELAQRFLANAKRDPSSRAYDERQATMLEYPHYIWREIAGRVGKLVELYGERQPSDAAES
jgi:hypothetical protein